MKGKNLSVAMATLVMETVADLQKSGRRAGLKEIKSRITEKYGNKAEKYIRLVPQFVAKGLNLGLIAKYGDNFRTKVYVARRKRPKRPRRPKGRRPKRRRR